MSQRHPALFITSSPLHGRGVFAAMDIEPGEIIEICPALVLPIAQQELIDKTDLYNYYFMWSDDETSIALILGYGSIYNHSYKPNAEFEPDYENNTLSVFCYKKIEAGDEITFNYNGNPESQKPVWFDKVNNQK